MTPPILIVKNLPALGMAIFPFILLKSEKYKGNWKIINHEKIHLRQQLELFILPFYIFYLINYLINLFKYKNHDEAYRDIVFEKEAYTNENNINYLKSRSWYSWIKHL